MKYLSVSISFAKLGILFFWCISLSLHSALAQERGNDFPRISPNAIISQTIGITDVAITYGRPSVKGRQVFGELEPYGKVWRTGANEATTITFKNDVKIEGKELSAGTYGLFTVPDKSEWIIIFNKVANQWGAFTYDEKQDVLRVKVKSQEGDHHELFTITFDEVTPYTAVVMLHWANVKIPFKIEVATDNIVRAQVDSTTKTSKDWQKLNQYVFFALYNKILIKDALIWADKSIALNANHRNLFMKAQVLAEIGQYKEAIATGKKAIDAGKAMEKQPQELSQMEELVKDWQSKL